MAERGAMKPVTGDVELSRDELKVLTALTSSPSLSEAARRTGFSRKYVRDVARRLNELGILVFFPDLPKIGLSLIFILSEGEMFSFVKKIPHFFLHLKSRGSGFLYVALADKRSLPEFSRKAFSGGGKFYTLGEVRGWNTAFIDFLAERDGLGETFTVNEVASIFIEYLLERFDGRDSLKRFLASLKVRDRQGGAGSDVYYVDMDEYDVTILDSKLADAFVSISSIAKRHGLYRQVLHYHYVNHVLPIWKYNIVMWKGVGKRFEPRLLIYDGEDVDVVEEFYRTMYPTVFTARPINQRDSLVVLTYLPPDREEALGKLSKRFSLRFAKRFEEELILSYYASRPFSRIYTESGWRSIYEDYLEATGM